MFGMSDVALSCRGLVKRYDDVVAVDGLDLEVRRGECFGLLGPNGAGKTTTVEVLEGLIPADAGEVTVLGRRWGHDDAQLRQRLGIQLQETRLTEKLTVRETVTLFRSFYREGRDPREVLALVTLEEKSAAWVGKLSGGQLQRLSLACALVADPDVLFLDEPTTGLDPQSRRNVWEIISDFRRGGGTVLLTTHYMEEAERLADRVAIMDRGKEIALGTPRELIASLGAEHVVEFECDPAGPAPDAGLLRSLDGVEALREESGGTSLTVSHVHRALPLLLSEIDRCGARLTRLATHHATLEDVFVGLTGRHLRED